MCCSSMSEWWYEPSWGIDCGPNLIRLIAKGYAQIVSDVSVDVSDVSELKVLDNPGVNQGTYFLTELGK